MKKLATTVTLLLVLALVTSCANHNPRKWTKKEIYKEVAFQVVNVAEKAVTYDVIHDDDRYSEGNTWLYGSDPSAEDLAIWAVGTGVLHYLGTDYFVNYDTPESTSFYQNATLGIYTGVFFWNLHFKF